MESNGTRLKVKIGEHEFEAEGPAELVKMQFEAFKELIAGLPAKAQANPEMSAEKEKLLNQLPHLPLDKIMKVSGRVISLTAKCDTTEEAILLILLGQKEFRGNQEVTGSEIMDGLVETGYQLERIDRILDKLSDGGGVITVGVHRARRYRLDNTGLNKALKIAKEVIATVP